MDTKGVSVVLVNSEKGKAFFKKKKEKEKEAKNKKTCKYVNCWNYGSVYACRMWGKKGDWF